MFESELRGAIAGLSPGVRVWLSRAVRSGWFEFGAGEYDRGPGGTRCPIAAAATMAGVWRDGAIAPGNPAWGTSLGPSPEVEEFAAYFDLHAEEAGLSSSLDVIREALESLGRKRRAA